MIKTYREHGQALCSACGRAGLTGHSGKEFYLKRYYHLGFCSVCNQWTVYFLDPDTFVEGDMVIITGKEIDMEMGSYTALADTRWKKFDIGIVLRINTCGGVVVRDISTHDRIGVFLPDDIALLVQWGVEFEPEEFPIFPGKEDTPKSWWVKLIDWFFKP